MARIRTVKPDFFRHAGLFDAEVEEGMPLRVAFAGLWTTADREGRFVWEPRNLKLDCLPHDEVDFSRVLDALATRGFIVKYACGGKEYGHIPSWHDHQVINNREAASAIPDPSEGTVIEVELTRASRVDDACPTPLVQVQGEGKGKEGKGREGKGKEGRADARIDFAFTGTVIRLNIKDFEKWRVAFPNLDLLAELTARDAWLASDAATDVDRKSWFHSTAQHLANRNQRAKNGAYEKPMSEADRIEAAALRGVEIWKPGAA